MLGSVTLGTINFMRVDKTERLLNSVRSDVISKVIIADNGKPSKKKRELYEREWDFELSVIYFPFNTPPSACVAKMIEHVDTKYFLLAENDLVLPSNITDLYKILKHDKTLGGVSGILLNHGVKISCGAHDIFVKKKYLIRDINDNIYYKVNTCGNLVYIYFDFIPNATLFRTKVFYDYNFDPNLEFTPHIDFYYGHWNLGKWNFAVCPHVVFQHHPGWENRQVEYMKYRLNKERIKKGYYSFIKKWGLRGIIWKRLFISNDIRTSTPLRLIKTFLPLSLCSKLDYSIIIKRSKKFS